jgi:thiamine-phosphate pyrophosphorylase
MLPECTPAVTRALEAAQVLARRDQSPCVDSIHLLHALLLEDEGRAATLAIGAGLDWTGYCRNRPEAPPASSASAVDLPMHFRALDALERARRLAIELTGEMAVASEALLLALCHGDEVSGILGQHGFRLAALEAALVSAAPPPPRLDEALRLSDATETMDLARILDASANRAREGLRVVEDYCRFVLDDAFLCGELKRLRHDLAEALTLLPPGLLIEGRETQRDVGKEVTTAAERERTSPEDVVQANLKRLQEALRSLEEFGKVRHPGLGLELEQLRYRTYTLERNIVLGSAARRRLMDVRLCVLLSGSQCTAAIDWTITEAVAGGVRLVQLREKNLPDRPLLVQANRACQAAHRAGALFIVNDRVDIARLVEADGVHLGQDDLPVKEARRILGPDAIIGVSTHNAEQLRQAILDGATYVGVGPAFSSTTKTFEELAGLEYVRLALRETSLPAFVIGGINSATIPRVVEVGACRVAVSAAIARADDPRRAAAELLAGLPEILT